MMARQNKKFWETVDNLRTGDVRNSSPDVCNSSPDVRNSSPDVDPVDEADRLLGVQPARERKPVRVTGKPGRPARAQTAADNSVRVRLTPDERATLDGLTARLGLSVSDTIRRALRELDERTQGGV